MKKYIYGILLLATAGAAVSGILLLQHYYPDSPIGSVFCGSGLVNSCASLNASKWSSFLGMPVAAHGLLFYLAVIFIVLIADYAGEQYYRYSAAVLLPLVLVSLAVDLGLLVLLIVLKTFCGLCVATYGINVLLLVAAIFWYRHLKRETGAGLSAWIKEMVSTENSPHKRAFFSTFTIFVFLLAFSVFSTSNILETRTQKETIPAGKIQQFLNEFYSSPVEDLSLPDTPLVLGDPEAEVTIVAFTDFLCSACYQFYKAEKYLLSRFRGKLRIIYYNYPLDGECNPTSNTLYENSCIASRSFMAAAKFGVLNRYIVQHFRGYSRYRHAYSEATATANLRAVLDQAGRNISAEGIKKMMNSDDLRSKVQDHVDAGNAARVDATPTLFISGRRIVGSLPNQVFEALIREELKRNR